MITASGRNCWQHDEGVPSLRDIGQGLGRISRFAGQTVEWYPVLAHVLTVATIVPPIAAIYGLFHDAPEAMTSDVPTPWKAKEQRELEHKLYERMCRAYGLPWPVPPEIQKEVEEGDYQALIAEAYVMGHSSPQGCVRRLEGGDETVVIGQVPYLDVVAELTKHNHAKALARVGNHPLPAFMIPEVSRAVFREAFLHFHAKSREAGLEVTDVQDAALLD